MTVKEVEERTGLPRANIRYYESEGLIHPARGRASFIPPGVRTATGTTTASSCSGAGGQLRSIPMASTPASATGAPPRAA